MSRLNDLYKGEIRKSLREKFGYTNEMEIPKLEKIVINIGVGEATENSKAVDAAASDLAAITGQKPLICKAHRSQAVKKFIHPFAAKCYFAAKRHAFTNLPCRRRSYGEFKGG